MISFKCYSRNFASKHIIVHEEGNVKKSFERKEAY